MVNFAATYVMQFRQNTSTHFSSFYDKGE